MGCRILVLSLAVLAGCARTSPPAPYELHTGAEPPAQSNPAGPHPDSVVVINGETLYGIARRYGLPVRAIIDANHLQPPYRLVSGSTITLPQVQTYKVRAGDTLALVARRNGVDMSTLAATNHLSPPFVIRIDQVLLLPSQVETGRAVPSRPAAEAASRQAPPVKAVESAPLQPPLPPGAPPPAGSPIAPQAAQPPPATEPPSPARAQPAAAPAPANVAASSPVLHRSTTDAAPARADKVVDEGKPPPMESQAKPAPPTERLAALPSFPVAGSGFLWPVRGRIVSAFGTEPDGMHNDGVNIAAPEGTPVVAAAPGEVAYAGNELKGYGNLILIKHPDGFITAYAHNSVLLVKRGDRVQRGQPIARVGATGAVSGPQLHFEIRRGSRALDPMEYLPAESAAK